MVVTVLGMIAALTFMVSTSLVVDLKRAQIALPPQRVTLQDQIRQHDYRQPTSFRQDEDDEDEGYYIDTVPLSVISELD